MIKDYNYYPILLLVSLAVFFVEPAKANTTDAELVEQKKKMAFPISKAITGYPYGFKVELTEREDGLVYKADSEYVKAAKNIIDFRDGKFTNRLPDHLKKEPITIPTPSTKGMLVMEDIVYAKWGKRAMLLDCYGPDKEGKEKLPVIVVVHGGGWGKGSHHNYRPFAINMAKRGFYTIAVEYRLSGEAPVPAAIYDLKACVRWVRANAEKYNFNADAIGITGGSAGGHLSAITAVTNDDIRFEGTDNNLEYSSKINAVLSFYGPFNGPFLKALGEEMEGRATKDDVAPNFHIRNGVKVPPLLCINELRPEESLHKHQTWGRGAVEWINENKTGEADFFIYDAPHGFVNFAPFQEKAIDHAEHFFRRIFKGKMNESSNDSISSQSK